MLKKTPLYKKHLKAHAKMVDFAGWEMPIQYGSQIEEHHAVRQDAGMFDVSHMTIVDVLGAGARDFLRYLLANDVDKIARRGKALYSCMLNHNGGVIDDVIVYFIDVHYYRIVLNAGTRVKDLAWMNRQANGFSVGLQERNDLAMLAVQGPNARQKVHQILHPAPLDAVSTLGVFDCIEVDSWFIARTGYTGEDGYEIIVPTGEIVKLWDNLLAQGVRPCGLGARDTLRLEAGLNLYGTDMDDTVSPLVSNLEWTVAWEPKDRLFIGRAALELEKREGVNQRLVGLLLEKGGVLRNHQKVIIEGIGQGEITSGSYSPTLGCSIALARVPKDTGMHAFVEIRGKQLPVLVGKPCFVRHGKKVFSNLNVT